MREGVAHEAARAEVGAAAALARVLVMAVLPFWGLAALLLILAMTVLAAPGGWLRGVGYYLIGVGLLHGLSLLYALTQTRWRPQDPLRCSYRWIGLWHLLTVAISLAGGVLGALLFSTVGLLGGFDYGLLTMMRRGFLDGAFYALIWGPALSAIVCVMRAQRAERGR